MNIGDRMKEARKTARLTQVQVAQRAEIAVNTLRLYEAGKRQPRIEQLQRIATALGVSEGYLLGYEQYRKDLRDKTPIIPEWTVPPTTTAEYHRARIGYHFDVVLNDAGQEKAAEAVEIIAGNPDYQRESWKQSQEAPESTPPAREGTDTTPPSDTPETPSEGVEEELS